MSGISGIDLFILIFFFIAVLSFGTFFRKYVNTSRDYFLSKKALPWWAIGMSIVVADIGATEYIGMAGGAYRFGLVQANFDWIGCMPAMIISAIIFIPYYWRAGVYTVPEYLGKRYNVYVRSIAACLWVAFLACAMGIILWASALVLNTLLGWPIWISIIATAAVVAIYTISGGLSAVVMTNAVQLIVMFIGGIALLVIGFLHTGGWNGLVEKIYSLGPQYADYFKLYLPMDTKTPYPWTAIIFGLTLVLSPAYWIGNQAIVQSALGARNEWDSKAGMMWAALLKVLIPVLLVFPGLIALALYSNLADGDRAIPVLIKEILPPGLTGLVAAAFFAALMSTVAIYLQSCATLFTKDVYQRFIKREASDKHYLTVGRIVTGGIIIWAVIFAPISNRFPGIFVALQTLLSIFMGPLFAILLLGMLWRRTTQWGGLAGLVGGVFISGTFFIFKAKLFTIQDPFLYIEWWSFMGSLIITIGVSLFTRPEPLEKLYGLVYRLIRNTEKD